MGSGPRRGTGGRPGPGGRRSRDRQGGSPARPLAHRAGPAGRPRSAAPPSCPRTGPDESGAGPPEATCCVNLCTVPSRRLTAVLATAVGHAYGPGGDRTVPGTDPGGRAARLFPSGVQAVSRALRGRGRADRGPTRPAEPVPGGPEHPAPIRRTHVNPAAPLLLLRRGAPAPERTVCGCVPRASGHEERTASRQTDDTPTIAEGLTMPPSGAAQRGVRLTVPQIDVRDCQSSCEEPIAGSVARGAADGNCGAEGACQPAAAAAVLAVRDVVTGVRRGEAPVIASRHL